MTPKKIKILYIDDEQNNLLGFKATFRLKFNVFTAINSEEAINILKNNADIRIIFSDQRMPEKTGVQFFDEIRDEYPLPVRILITAYTDIDAVIDAINKGHIFRYVKKPWEEADILKVIEEAEQHYNANASLQLRNDELATAYKELDKFAYSVSHDIRGPMSGVLTAIDFARNLDDIDEIRNVLDMMEKSIHKLDEYIITMHDYYNLQKGALKIATIDFNELVKDYKDIFDTYASAEDIYFTATVEQQEPFFSDMMSLRLIFNNMLSNAFKYQRRDNPAKTVHLKVRVQNGLATFIVQDNGVGIAGNHIPEIFDLHFRSNETEAGFGFGLYNLKGAIMKLNGLIDVDSRIGEGTTFKITIPNLQQDPI